MSQEQKFLMVLIHLKYQYILQDIVMGAGHTITIDRHMFLSIIQQGFYVFISTFQKNRQFEQLMKHQDIFTQVMAKDFPFIYRLEIIQTIS